MFGGGVNYPLANLLLWLSAWGGEANFSPTDLPFWLDVGVGCGGGKGGR